MRASSPAGESSTTYRVRVVRGERSTTSAVNRPGDRTKRSTASVSLPRRVTKAALSGAGSDARAPAQPHAK
jgi:hypothetical protein